MFYLNGKPQVVDVPGLGTIVDWGIRKTLVGTVTAAAKMKEAILAATSFSVDEENGQTTLFSCGEPYHQTDTLKLYKATVKQFSDTGKPLYDDNKSMAFQFKLGTLNIVSDLFYLPGVLSEAQLLTFGSEISNFFKELSGAASNQISTGVTSKLISPNLFELDTRLWHAAAGSMALYRSDTPLFQKTVKAIHSMLLRIELSDSGLEENDPVAEVGDGTDEG